jgi:serine/threonine protein kinase
MFAMKVIRKEYTVKKEQGKHAVQERRIMAAVSFPFLVKLESHFQTRNSLCLAMELVWGGELFTHLREVGSFEEYKARRGLITAGVIKVFMQDNPSNLK